MSERIKEVPATAWEIVSQYCESGGHHLKKHYTEEQEKLIWALRNPPGGMQPAGWESVETAFRQVFGEPRGRQHMSKMYRDSALKDKYEWVGENVERKGGD